MAAVAALSGIAATVGPILGPTLLSWDLAGQGWRLVFWVNVPIGIVAAITASMVLPAATATGTGRLHLPAVLLASLGLTLVLYPLIAASGHTQWPSWTYPVLAAGACSCSPRSASSNDTRSPAAGNPCSTSDCSRAAPWPAGSSSSSCSWSRSWGSS